MKNLLLNLCRRETYFFPIFFFAFLGICQSSAQSVPKPPEGYTQEDWDAVKALQLQQVEDAKKVSSLKENSIAAVLPRSAAGNVKLCDQPQLSRRQGVRSRTPIFYLRWEKDPGRDLGSSATGKAINMTADCIPKPIIRSVTNETPIHIFILQDSRASCGATVTYSDDPVKDYGSVFLALFTPTNIAAQKAQGLKTSTEIFETIELPSKKVSNTTATVTISCNATQAKNACPIALGVEQKVIIHYGGVDLFSGSAGAIVSTLGKKNYATVTSDTGLKNVDGTPITSSVIGVTSSSNAQFVPMGLVNWNLSGTENLNLNMQFGLGINPNGSTTQVEYFLSPLAISVHHVYFAAGVHVAQSQRIGNGFYLGEAVASGFSLPSKYQTTYKFGVSISIKPYK